MGLSPPRQLGLQGGAAALVLGAAVLLPALRAGSQPILTLALATGAVAGTLASLLGQPWWWRLLHTACMPAVWAAGQVAVDPRWYLAGFVSLLLVYRGAVASRVPLFLTNRETLAALSGLLAELARPALFVDLGAGVGSAVGPLAARHPEVRFAGHENAPLPWVVGWLRTRGRANLVWRYGDLFAAPLGDADVVYAFLSPVPMPALWEKVRAEMKPGSLFVSNSFPVPDVSPERVVEGRRPLYCYRVSPG